MQGKDADDDTDVVVASLADVDVVVVEKQSDIAVLPHCSSWQRSVVAGMKDSTSHDPVQLPLA